MRKLLTAILLCVAAATAGASVPVLPDTVTASDAFVALPISNLDLLGKSTRLDMLDFFQADSVYQAPNALQGVSFLKTVRPDFLEVCLTPVSSLSLSMLPYKEGKMLVTTYTLGDNDEAFDTDVRFFDGDYNELPRDKFIKFAVLEDFFTYPDKAARDKVEELIPFTTVKYVSDPDKGTLTATLTSEQVMSKDDYESIKRYMKGPLVYKWNGKRYQLQKK